MFVGHRAQSVLATAAVWLLAMSVSLFANDAKAASNKLISAKQFLKLSSRQQVRLIKAMQKDLKRIERIKKSKTKVGYNDFFLRLLLPQSVADGRQWCVNNASIVYTESCGRGSGEG